MLGDSAITDGGRYFLPVSAAVERFGLGKLFPHFLYYLYNDDLSAFGSSILLCWPDYHSDTRFGIGVSLMKNLSYLILFCLKIKNKIQAFYNVHIVTYANILSQVLPLLPCALTYAGFRVNACDREERYEALKEEFANKVNIFDIA
jgi:hypothetical protein